MFSTIVMPASNQKLLSDFIFLMKTRFAHHVGTSEICVKHRVTVDFETTSDFLSKMSLSWDKKSYINKKHLFMKTRPQVSVYYFWEKFHLDVWWGSACAFGFIWRKKDVCFNLCYEEFSSFSWIGVLLCFCFFHLYIAFVYCIWVVNYCFLQRGCCILYLFMTMFKCLFYMAVSTSLIWCYFNHGHNILRLFDGSPNFPFATS